MLKDDRIKVLLQLFADEGGDNGPNAGGDNNGGDNQDGAGDNAGDNAGNPETKTFTQEELDRIIQQRLKRERQQWEKQIEEEKRKAAMTEAERLKAEKEEAERKAQAVTEAANRRIINAEARVQAISLGVKPERVEYALRLADLSGVEVDENGNPDAAGIKAAIEAVLKDLPELKGQASPGKSGSEFQGGSGMGAKPNTLLGAIQAHYRK